jgi:hypothetical protein
MRASGTRSTSQIEDFGTRTESEDVDSGDNEGSDLGSVRVPNSVLDFLVVLFNGDSLLTIDTFSWAN